MSDSYEDETDVSDSELDEYADKCYEQLNRDPRLVKFSDDMYRCPYCPGKKKVLYVFQDILQHASDVGKGSYNGQIKHTARHLGLVRFLNNENGATLLSDLSGLSIEDNCLSELFVYPWVGVVANVKGENTCSGIKNELVNKGFKTTRVRLLPGSGYAVVEFKRDWSGFYNAIVFEKEFQANRHGKKDHLLGNVTGLCGWVAKEDDYNAENKLGKFLQKNGDLKTVNQVESDEKRKTNLLIDNLTSTIDSLRMRISELESRNCREF